MSTRLKQSIARAKTLRAQNPKWERVWQDLEGSPDLEDVREFRKSSQDIVTFVCKTHGTYQQKLNAHVSGQGCPLCFKERRGSVLGRMKRACNPLPSWFLKDCEHLPIYQKIKEGGIPMHTKVKFICKVHGEYQQALYNHLNGQGCPQCSRYGWRSKREIEIESWLTAKGVRVISNAKGLGLNVGKSNYEIDLYCPDYKIGFEFNGYYYHKSGVGGKSKDYHKVKTELAAKVGIKLYHIWEDTPTGLVKSIILAKLGKLPYKVGARKCSIVEGVDAEFFQRNHVQGSCRVCAQFSLIYKGIKVASLSLRKHSEGLEIARFATLRGWCVQGAYSKLLAKALEGYTGKLISYCDVDLSPTTDFYKEHGFVEEHRSLIMKYWCNGHVKVNGKEFNQGIYPRQTFQKWKLAEWSNDGKTEQEILEHHQIYPVFNSGNIKYVINVKNGHLCPEHLL